MNSIIAIPRSFARDLYDALFAGHGVGNFGKAPLALLQVSLDICMWDINNWNNLILKY